MKYLTTLIALLICQLTYAQIPSLQVEQEGKKEKTDLQISQLNVDVEIIGNIATTTFDIVFYNPFDRDMEGELSMPLREGQDICRYALDVNGNLREGVVIEKVKARQAYEAVLTY